MKKNSTLAKIITKVDCSRGAPMGRVGTDNRETVTTADGKEFKKFSGKVYDSAVPLSGDGSYDIGGAYWGLGVNGSRIRVQYTKDLQYVHFYWTEGYNK